MSPASHFPLCGRRLTIREIGLADVDDFHAIIQQPTFSYYLFDGTRASVEKFVGDAIKGQQSTTPDLARKSYMLAVIDNAEQQIVGHVALDILPKQPDYYDLGYFIAPTAQGKGFATEAAHMLLTCFFVTLALDKIIATVNPENKPSHAVLQKLGFTNTGKTIRLDNGTNDLMLLELRRKALASF